MSYSMQIENVLELIKSGQLVSSFNELNDWDAILDERDKNPDFESAWRKCFDEIERAWEKAAVSSEVSLMIETIRCEVFLDVSRATNQHEIASYVSDDFDIIARSSVLKWNDSFIEHLWNTYQSGEIPTSPRSSV